MLTPALGRIRNSVPTHRHKPESKERRTSVQLLARHSARTGSWVSFRISNYKSTCGSAAPLNRLRKSAGLFGLGGRPKTWGKLVNMEAMSNRPLFVTGWEVTGIRCAEEFFSALVELLPLPVYLCFEGTSIASDVRALLASNAVAALLQIPAGTLWPKPSVFHIFAREQFIRELAELAGRHAEPEICDHFHAYNDGHGLMQWYDAFDLPLLIDEAIAEATLRSFCRKLGVRYARWHAG
jgi:hypothetical protein